MHHFTPISDSHTLLGGCPLAPSSCWRVAVSCWVSTPPLYSTPVMWSFCMVPWWYGLWIALCVLHDVITHHVWACVLLWCILMHTYFRTLECTHTCTFSVYYYYFSTDQYYFQWNSRRSGYPMKHVEWKTGSSSNVDPICLEDTMLRQPVHKGEIFVLGVLISCLF